MRLFMKQNLSVLFLGLLLTSAQSVQTVGCISFFKTDYTSVEGNRRFCNHLEKKYDLFLSNSDEEYRNTL